MKNAFKNSDFQRLKHKKEEVKKRLLNNNKIDIMCLQGWYAEFLLKIVLQFLIGKVAARLIFKIMLKSLHIDPGNRNRERLSDSIFKH